MHFSTHFSYIYTFIQSVFTSNYVSKRIQAHIYSCILYIYTLNAKTTFLINTLPFLRFIVAFSLYCHRFLIIRLTIKVQAQLSPANIRFKTFKLENLLEISDKIRVFKIEQSRKLEIGNKIIEFK